MQLDKIVTEPIISTENAAFSPIGSPIEDLPLVSEVIRTPFEQDPLLGAPKPKKPFYRARPLWLVPFALTISITRGMTVAPRVEVFTELSCRQLHTNYGHLTVPTVGSTHVSIHPLVVDANSGSTPLYLPSILQIAQSLEESEGDGIHEGDDPRVIPGKRCTSDPAVQAGAAQLQTIMTTTMGTLSALTVGWWGHFGERYGRTRVLAISTLGLFLTDLTFILVSTPGNPLATHSHKLLILAPIIEGLLGGWSALASATTAYIADCTSPGSRATVFARFTGVLAVGLALGPIVGAWLIRNPIPFLRVGRASHPLESVNSVFWVAICGTFVNFLLVLFAIPESLPASRRAMNRKGKNRTLGDNEVNVSTDRSCLPVRVVKSIFSPLSEFLPTDVPEACPAGMPDQTVTRKDWGLTYLALSLFFYTLASGVFQIKYLYATHVYDWAAEQLSYYISFVGGIRAFHLLVLLPSLLVTFKPVHAAVSAASTRPNANGIKVKPKPTKSYLLSEVRFDLRVIRCLMFVDFCSNALVVICPAPSGGAESTWWSQFMFVAATSLGSASAGVTPAAQSFGLSTLQGRKMAKVERTAQLQDDNNMTPAEQDVTPDSGKLLAAVAVLQAISQTILGPIVFGVIYSSTVADFPKAVFAVAGALVLAAIILTVFIKPDASLTTLKSNGKMISGIESRRRVRVGRGRSRASKDLRGSSPSPPHGYGTEGCGTDFRTGEAGSSEFGRIW